MKPAKGSVERRLWSGDDLLELRSREGASDETEIPIKGYAAVFGKSASIAGIFTESFAAGAFKKSVREQDLRLLSNHDQNLLLARKGSGTLRAQEDETGLRFEAEMAPTSYGRDLALLIERGDLNGMSIAFQAVRQEWDETRKVPHRTITEARLNEISIVTFPAYAETSLSLRSLDLGLLGFSDEERTEIMKGLMGEGETASFQRIQERLSSLLQERQEAASAPPGGESAPSIRAGSLALYRQRERFLASRFGLSI